VGRFSWAIYDWANSPFTTLIVTFIFPAYFQAAVVGDPVKGQAIWGYVIAGSGILIAIVAPPLGAIADVGGSRKPWVLVFTAICAVSSALLWFVFPSPAFVGFTVVCVVIANIGFEFGVVFNNAMLPDLTPPSRLGRLSGWAWGLGYAGGLTALTLALLVLNQPGTAPLGLDRQAAEDVRIIGPLVGIWLLVFSTPLFLFTWDRSRTSVPLAVAVRSGLAATRETFSDLRKHRNALRFLLAHMIYADGLVTLFAFGGLYASGVFNLSVPEVIQFGIALNVAAGLGAFSFAWIDDWLGSKRTIVLALIGLIISSLVAIAAHSVAWLWVAGIGIGTFVGPAQAASRSLMARLSPPEKEAECFGLFALSGRATSFVGPAIVAVATDILGSQRAGLASILILFFVGLLILLPVQERASTLAEQSLSPSQVAPAPHRRGPPLT